MHGLNKQPLVAFLEEAGLPAPDRTPRVDAHQEALKAHAAVVRQWRSYATTTTPAESLERLQQVRSLTGLSVGDVSDICGVSPSDVEAAERGLDTIADSALRSWLGAATTALLSQDNS